MNCVDGREEVASLVPRGTFNKIERYVALVRDEAVNQNLVASSTLETFWRRHVLDSLQLLDLAPSEGLWIDVGSGAGLPGMIVALAGDHKVCLVEPRARRAAFLSHVVGELGVGNRVKVTVTRVQNVPAATASIISARAVAHLAELVEMASHLAGKQTLWLLPKGRSASEEVVVTRENWHGRFELVPSRTDPASMIVVASDLRRKGKS